MKLDINTDAVIRFTNILEKMHRSALPVAIRETLNNAAFDVKSNTMPESANKAFEKRSPNFFRANSSYTKATGFKIDAMEATIGFTDTRLKDHSKNNAVSDLEQQENGGRIGGRSFIPLPDARKGASNSQNVITAFRIGKAGRISGKIVNASEVAGDNTKEKFANAKKMAGRGGFVLGNAIFKNGNKILWKIDSSKKMRKLYIVKSNRSVKVDSTRFMHIASLKSASNIEEWYIRQAEKQIARLK